jgi:hypothetical protein
MTLMVLRFYGIYRNILKHEKTINLTKGSMKLFRKYQGLFVFMVITLLTCRGGYAAPLNVSELKVSPHKKTVSIGSGPMTMILDVEGKDLKFNWQVVIGPGKVMVKEAGLALYIPPTKIEITPTKVMVMVTVTDYKGRINTKHAAFNLVSSNSIPSEGTDGVRIVQPIDGDSVPSGNVTPFKVKGTYSEKIKDDIWVIVWPDKSLRGWPQSDDAGGGVPAVKKNGKWSVTCYFGGPPQSYEITVYTATRSASNFLGAKIKEWYKQNDYLGLLVDQIPEGLTEKHRIQITKP